MASHDLERRLRALLPLDPKEYHLLFALHGRPMHGYGLCKELSRRTGGAIEMAPGNLYRVIRRLMADGLVVDAPEVGDDERRKYYRLTELGRVALAAEAERMRVLVDEADDARLPQALKDTLA